MAYPLRSKTAISGFSLPYEDIGSMKKVNKGRLARNKITCHECFEGFTSDFDYDAHTQICQIKYIQKVKEQEAIYENHLKRISQDTPCFLSAMKLIPNSDDGLNNIKGMNNQHVESQLPYDNSNHTITSLSNHPKFFHEFKKINCLLKRSICYPPIEGVREKAALNVLTDFPPSPLWLSNHNAQAVLAEKYKTRFSSRHLKIIKSICVTNSIKEPRYYNNINLTSLLCQQSFDKYVKFFKKQINYVDEQKFELTSYDDKVDYMETTCTNVICNSVHAFKKPIMYLKTPKYEKYCERYEYTPYGHQNGKNLREQDALVLTKSDDKLSLSSFLDFPDKLKTKQGSNFEINGLINKMRKVVEDDNGTILTRDFLFSALYDSVFSQLVYKKYLPCLNLQNLNLRFHHAEKTLSTSQELRQQILEDSIKLRSSLNNQMTMFSEYYIQHLSRLQPPTYIPPYSICTCCFYQVKSSDSQQSHALNISQSLLKYAKSKTQTTKSLAIKKKYSPLHKKKAKFNAAKLSPVKPREIVVTQPKLSPRKLNVVGGKSILIDLTDEEVISQSASISSQLSPKFKSYARHESEPRDNVMLVDLTLDSDTETLSCKSYASQSSATSTLTVSVNSSAEELRNNSKTETQVNIRDVSDRVAFPRLKRTIRAPLCCSTEEGPCSSPGHKAKRSKLRSKPKSILDSKVQHAHHNSPPLQAKLLNGHQTNDRAYFKPRKKSKMNCDKVSPIKSKTMTQYPRDKLDYKNMANGHIGGSNVGNILPKCKLLLHCHLCAHKESFQSQEDIQMKIAYHCSNYHKNVQFYIDMSETHDFETGYDVTLVECRPS